MTDAGPLSRATVWAATDPRAANQAFTINDGDLFRSTKRTSRPTRDAHAASTGPKRLLVHSAIAGGAARTSP